MNVRVCVGLWKSGKWRIKWFWVGIWRLYGGFNWGFGIGCWLIWINVG